MERPANRNKLLITISRLSLLSAFFSLPLPDIRQTPKARDSIKESIGRGAYSQRRMVYVSYPGAVSKANVGISNDKEG